MKDVAETPDASKDTPLNLKPANENPWYVLMTLYGDDYEANVLAWNSWATQNLSPEELARRDEISHWGILQIPNLENWVNIKEEVQEAFKNRFKMLNGEEVEIPKIPLPSYSIDFRNTKFEEAFVASDRFFPTQVLLNGAWFCERFEIERCHFSGVFESHGACYERAVHGDKTYFAEECRFQEVTFKDRVSYSGTLFKKTSSFFKAEFERHADFAVAIFDKGATFRSAVFNRYVSFKGAKFLQGAEFNAARFLETAQFSNSSFCGDSVFSGVTFHGFSDFSGAVFGHGHSQDRSAVLFENCIFEKPSSFVRSVFRDSYPDFSGAVLHEQSGFTARRDPTERDVHQYKFSKEHTFWPDETGQNPEEARESCATIRHLLAKQGLPEDEHFFFRREMQFARRIGTPLERLPYQLFGIFSEYGYSIKRPLWWLFGLWFVSFGYFSYVFHKPVPGLQSDPTDWTAMGLSLSNLFPVFGFARLYYGKTFMEVMPWDVQVLSGFQTVMALPLIFFLGLALRQRFRLR